MIEYDYEVKGKGGNGNTWEHSGSLSIAGMGEFMSVPTTVIRESFMAITSGKAVFGQPGVGCQGPYAVEEMHIVRKR